MITRLRRRITRRRREEANAAALVAATPPGPPTHNIRDVAGLPAGGGASGATGGGYGDRTRPGILLRGDAPFADDGPSAPGWPEGLAWPPGVAIDLRSDRELDDPHPLVAAGTTVIHLPLIDGLDPELLARGRAGRLGPGEMYLGILDGAAGWLPTMLDAAIDGPHPVLVHCAAGKDRTGVTVAALLRLAGVTRAAVEADFVRTNSRRVGLQLRLERRGEMRPGVVPPGEVGVTREDLTGVLDRLDGDGAARLARDAGVPDDRVEQWRATLLR